MSTLTPTNNHNLMSKDAIIILTTWEFEVKELYEYIGSNFQSTTFWGGKRQEFDKKDWVWVIDGKNLSGTSGFNSLSFTIHQNPGSRIYNFPDFSKQYMQPKNNYFKKSTT